MPTRQNCMLQLAFIVAAVVLPSPVVGQQSVAFAGAIPAGWYVYPEDKLKNWPKNSTWSPCPSDSLTDWQVSAEGDALRITKLVNDRTSKSQDKSEVREMIPVDDGVLVLSGLAHVTIDFGNAFIFSNPDGMNISLQHAVRLDGEPSGYAKEPNGSVLFVTTYGLCRITKSGELQRLTGFPRWSQHEFTNSMVITSDGSIFIGTRMFVLRLRKNSDRYRTEWLLPKECR